MKVAGLFLAILIGAAVTPVFNTTAICQVVGGTVNESPDWRVNHSPRKALRRAAILPGWGQLYNRQYGKIPVVYVVIGGLTANTVRLNRKYLLYRHAYQYKAFEEIIEEGEENPRASFEADYSRLVEKLGGISISASTIKPSRDSLRRNRDLSILGIGATYGLAILDAYVSAHLLDFDVGEDLLVSVSPTPLGVTTSLTITL